MFVSRGRNNRNNKSLLDDKKPQMAESCCGFGESDCALSLLLSCLEGTFLLCYFSENEDAEKRDLEKNGDGPSKATKKASALNEVCY